jgi:hypothetical protein
MRDMQQQLAVLRDDNSTNECILEVLQFLQTHVLRSATSTQALGSGVLLSTLVGIAERHLKLSIVCTQIMECLLLLVSHCCKNEEQAFSEEQRYTLIKFIAAKKLCCVAGKLPQRHPTRRAAQASSAIYKRHGTHAE